MKKLLTLIILVMIIGNGTGFGQALSGTYYIGDAGTKPGGGDPEYTTLKGACDDLNSKGVGAPCIFYFTESKTYIEGNDIWLGVTGTSSTNTITFKPYTAVVCTLSFTNLNNSGLSGSIDGCFAIGSPTGVNTNLVPTSYLIIDGSNSNDGTSRDLIIIGPGTSLQKSVIRIFGNNDYITIKNCEIINNSTSSSSTAPINITNYSASNYSPDNFTISNNILISNNGNGGLGVYISNSGTPTVGCTNITINGNSILHRRTRGIMFNYVNDANVFDNSFSANLQLSSGAGAGVYLTTGTGNNGTFNIYNNKFSSLSFLNNTAGASNGYIAIDNQLATPKIVKIYNNFITGFTITDLVANSKIYGIRHTSTSISYIYNNTIVLPEMINMTNFGSSLIAGIAFATAATTEISPNGKCFLKSNIIVSKETTMKTWCIRRVGTGGTFTSNYNNLFLDNQTNSFIGYSNNQDKSTLVDWQGTPIARDTNSVSKSVSFTSATDLHLFDTSIGDYDLTGTPISGITTDIDGNTRDALFPYMGADENTTYYLHSKTPRTVPMTAAVNNATAFGTKGVLGTDGDATFYAHWDATYLYLGWSGGKTNYSSDMYYAAIDTDPDGSNGTDNTVNGVSFLNGAPNPDFYVVYENNESFYGLPVTNGNAFEIYNVNSGWQFLSRADGDNGTDSQVDFKDAGGEVRYRIPWSTLNFTPQSGSKIGIVMWNNNASSNYMWGRVPTNNPTNGSTPKTLENMFVFDNTGSGVDVSIDGILTALPVELTSFQANYNENLVTLTWQTATEINSYCFEVERSNDNTTWVKIGSVNAGGNSNKVLNYEYFDNITTDGKYYYRLKQIDLDGSFKYTSVVEVNAVMPMLYSLSQNYPNPFNPTTKINYSIPVNAKVTLNIYSITGELVTTLVDEDLTAGNYTIDFDASKLASGTYFYRIIANDFVQTKKMLLIK